MKKLIAVLLLLLATFAFVSCDDESEEADPDKAMVTIYQENDTEYFNPKVDLVRIGDTEWEDIEYKDYSAQKNVEPGEYIVEVWGRNPGEAEDHWLEYYNTDDQKTSNRFTLEEGKKYQVRLLNDWSIECEEMLTK